MGLSENRLAYVSQVYLMIRRHAQVGRQATRMVHFRNDDHMLVHGRPTPYNLIGISPNLQ